MWKNAKVPKRVKVEGDEGEFEILSFDENGVTVSYGSDSTGFIAYSDCTPIYEEEEAKEECAPYQKQVGGNHYKGFAIQPAHFIHANGIGFLAGNVIKYTCRHSGKNGKQDLLKAIHYLEMLIEEEYPDNPPTP